MKKMATIIFLALIAIIFAVPQGETLSQKDEKRVFVEAPPYIAQVGDILVIEYQKGNKQCKGFKKVLKISLKKNEVILSEVNTPQEDEFVYDLNLQFARPQNSLDGEWVLHLYEVFRWIETLDQSDNDDDYKTINEKYFIKKLRKEKEK